MPISNIAQVQATSPLFDLQEKLAICAYFFLLASARHTDEGYMARCDVPFDDEIIDVLTEHDYVKIHEECYFLSDEEGNLFVNTSNPFQQEITEFEPFYSALKNSRKKSARFRDNEMIEQADRFWLLLSYPHKYLKKVSDLIDIYKGAYLLLMEEKHRELTGKEAGQFKQLLRFYAPVTAAKMCIRYLLHEEKAPSIGKLLTLKDEIYHMLVKPLKSNKHGSTGGSF